MLRSFQKTVAAAGTAEQVTTNDRESLYYLRAHQGNTGENVYVGNDGNDDVSATTGLCLNKLDDPIMFKGDLSEMWVDVGTAGDKLTVMEVINS